MIGAVDRTEYDQLVAERDRALEAQPTPTSRDDEEARIRYLKVGADYQQRINGTPFMFQMNIAGNRQLAREIDALQESVAALRALAGTDVRLQHVVDAAVLAYVGRSLSSPAISADYFGMASPTALVADVAEEGSAVAACVMSTGVEKCWDQERIIWAGEGPIGELLSDYVATMAQRTLEFASRTASMRHELAASQTPEEYARVESVMTRTFDALRAGAWVLLDETDRRLFMVGDTACPDGLRDRLTAIYIRRTCPLLGSKQWLEGEGREFVQSLAGPDSEQGKQMMAILSEFDAELLLARRGAVENIVALRRLLAKDPSGTLPIVQKHDAIAEQLWGPQRRALARIKGLLSPTTIAVFERQLLLVSGPKYGAVRPETWADNLARRLNTGAP